MPLISHQLSLSPSILVLILDLKPWFEALPFNVALPLILATSQALLICSYVLMVFFFFRCIDVSCFHVRRFFFGDVQMLVVSCETGFFWDALMFVVSCERIVISVFFFFFLAVWCLVLFSYERHLSFQIFLWETLD